MRITEQYLNFSRKAEQVLLKSNVYAFPAEPIQIARKNGALVTEYEKFSKVSGVPVQELLNISDDGFCMLRNGSPVIVYNRQVASKGRKRWTILHELSHILLGHISREHTVVYDRSRSVKRWMEQEADCLTACLAAPMPVALICGINSAEEMRALFGLSRQASQNLFQDYQELCIGRKILAIRSDQLLQNCVRFFGEWQLKRFYLEQERHFRGERGKQLQLEIVPEQNELAD